MACAETPAPANSIPASSGPTFDFAIDDSIQTNGHVYYPSPPESRSDGTEVFKFINSFSPEDAKSSSHRRAVRSQAARPQHTRNGLTSVPNSPKVKRKYPRSKKNLTFKIPLGLDLGAPNLTDEKTTSCKDKNGVSRDSALPVLRPDRVWMEPFGAVTISNSSQRIAPSIINHYLAELAVDIPELDLEGNHGLLRSRWFPMVLTDAALLQVILLTSASHFAMEQGTVNFASQLLHMRQEAIILINGLLRDPERSLSDCAIAAVAKMASYEAMYGEKVAYHVHMMGLQHMVKLRGGLDSLGLDGLLARMLLWIDNNASFLIDSHLYFASFTTTLGTTLAPPNPSKFLGVS